jgi:hypothetical protein
LFAKVYLHQEAPGSIAIAGPTPCTCQQFRLRVPFLDPLDRFVVLVDLFG